MLWSSISCVTNSVCNTLSARFRAVPRDVVADAAMEAQYRLCRKFYRPDDETLPLEEPMAWRWMAITAERILLRERRRASAHQPLSSSGDADDDGSYRNAEIASQAEIYNVEDDLAATLTVAALMNLLSPTLAEVVRLHDIEGIPLDDIARDLGCTAASVRQRHSRGLRGLRRLWHAEHQRAGCCVGCDCGGRTPGIEPGAA